MKELLNTEVEIENEKTTDLNDFDFSEDIEVDESDRHRNFN